MSYPPAYPDWFDSIDLSECEDCTFDCDIYGYCIKNNDG